MNFILADNIKIKKEEKSEDIKENYNYIPGPSTSQVKIEPNVLCKFPLIHTKISSHI